MLAMKSQQTFAYTITCLLAIFLSVCTALPINVTSIASNHANELIIGFLALTCISVAIVACACCHSNKGGFKEFENETIYNTNSSSRSEFPIFRAITPSTLGHHHHLNSSNSSESAVIIDSRTPPNDPFAIHLDQNINNERFNNNGPLSTTDLENIQNNNAVDYIQDRYEIEANQSQRVQLQHTNGADASASLATDPIPAHVSHNNPTTAESYQEERFLFEADMMQSSSSGDFDEFHLERTYSAKARNVDPLSDDSVEEALRVLDSAISGGESFLFDDGDDSDMEYPYNSSHICGTIDEEDLRSDNFTIPSQFEAIAVIETFDAKDITSSNNDNDALVLNSKQYGCAQVEQHEQTANDIRDASEALVDDILATAALAVETMQLNNENAYDIESQLPIISNSKDVDIDYDGSKSTANAAVEIADVIVQLANSKTNEEFVESRNDEAADIAVRSANVLNNEFATKSHHTQIEVIIDKPINEVADDHTISHPVIGAFVDSVIDIAVKRVTEILADQADKSIAHTLLNRTNENLDKLNAESTAAAIHLDESLNASFVSGQLIASTPCHKNLKTANRETNNGVCLFDTLTEISESELSAVGFGTLQTTANNSSDDLEVVGQICDHLTIDKSMDGQPITEKFTANETEQKVDVVDKTATLTQNIALVCNDTFVGSSTFVKSFNNDILGATFCKNEHGDQTFIAANASSFQQGTETMKPNQNKIHNDEVAANETFCKNEHGDQTFVAASNIQDTEITKPIIKIDKDEVASDDLTTITPMNTPIELNYSGDSWDELISTNSRKIIQPTTSNQSAAMALTTVNNSWYLHPQQHKDCDDESNDYQYFGMDDDSESLEENPELLSHTFDALRKQLADVLPHASVRPSIDYSDDENDYNGSDSDNDCDDPAAKAVNLMLRFAQKNASPHDDIPTDVVINYKQQLSPIIEESEDETCKTFVFNQTKCMDSTSTGCIETSEAIMGVSKVLMASNDTLFNFEDTLGDRDDTFSPSHQYAASIAYASRSPQPLVECKTPTREQHTSSTNDLSEETPTLKEPLPKQLLPLSLTFDGNAGGLNELMSPEQQKTFSEEIQTLEQVSSDLSATVEGNSNTMDDLKTCISVHFNDETITADNMPKESIVPVSNGIDVGSDQFVGSISTESSMQSSLDSLEPLQTLAGHSKKTKSTETIQNQNIDVTADSDGHTVSDKDDMHTLSGEEDPWASHSMLDVVYSTHDKPSHQPEYITNDWDSEIEDSNSSEEFLYTKETTDLYEYMNNHSSSVAASSSNTDGAAQSTEDQCNGSDLDEPIDKHWTAQDNKELQTQHDGNADAQEIWSVWNNHEDLIAVSTNAGAVDLADDMLDESSLSENEDEWVPSSWDSLAKPVRSALKSPDKSSSEEETSPKTGNGSKNRRNVVFKKQNYHSIYEYPKENSLVSPTLNETKLWASYLATSTPFSTSVSDSYLNKEEENFYGNKHLVDFNALDGFTVSSSSRPFHISQYSNECHTWPNDADFSWSQFQNSSKLNTNERITMKNELIEWKFHSDQMANDTAKASASTNDANESESTTSTNQSNEMVQMTAGKLSLGDLCHTKASLRLPLSTYVATTCSDAKAQPHAAPAEDHIDSSKTNSQQDFSETSYTGSMDSINSFDGGKATRYQSDQNSTNTDGLTVTSESGIVSSNGSCENAMKHTDTDAAETFRTSSQQTSGHETDTSATINGTMMMKCDLRASASRQSDSTDEDSGIENIRIAKDI